MKSHRLNISLTALMHDRRGTIAVAAGIILPVMLAATALAVDVGQAYLDRRTAQSVVDLAAINAADNIDIADEAARATLAANHFQGLKSLHVVKGRYTPDAKIAPESRFAAGAQPYNAVQVSIAKKVKLSFAATFMRSDMNLSVSAVAQASAQATFSVGSRLAAVRGGIANQVLGALLGTNVSLTAMDYEALANANVRIDDLLGSVDGAADLKAATFNDVVKADVAMSDLIAGASAATATNNPAASALLGQLAGRTPRSLRLPMSALFDIGALGSTQIGNKNAALGVTVAALDILQSAALVANGKNQLAITFDLGVPGVSKLTATVYVGQRPVQSSWVSVGDPEASVSTVQTRIRLVAEIGGSGPLAGIAIRLPIYADLASARATLDSVSCSDQDKSATIGVQTGVGRIALADLTDAEFADPPAALASAKVVTTPLLTVTAGAQVAIQNSDPVALTFTSDDVENLTIKRASTTSLTQSIVSSLLGSADIKIKALGLTAPLVTKNSLLNVLNPIADQLDGVLLELLEAFGVKVGEADVVVHGISCENSNLAG